jgi:hypothetical protein
MANVTNMATATIPRARLFFMTQVPPFAGEVGFSNVTGKRDAIFRRSSPGCQVAGEQQKKAPGGPLSLETRLSAGRRRR